MPKTIVITGSSDGIGAAAARRLSLDGHTVVVVGRSREKARELAREIGSDYFVADFARLDDVRTLAAGLAGNYPRIDVLANNAGALCPAAERSIDGFDLNMQVNHLAPFLLTNLLLPTLENSGATVIQTSSSASRKRGRIVLDDLNNTAKRSSGLCYSDAKLAGVLFTAELQRRYGRRGIAAAAFHPGSVASSFEATSPVKRAFYANGLVRRYLATPAAGARSLVWLATSDPGTVWTPGAYYEKRRVYTGPNPQLGSPELAKELWNVSARMVGLAA